MTNHWYYYPKPVNRAELPPPSLLKHCFSVAGWFGIIVPVISHSMYLLLTASPQFQVDPSSGEITTIQELDREQRDSFNFVVEARDGGSLRMSSRVSVCVL